MIFRKRHQASVTHTAEVTEELDQIQAKLEADAPLTRAFSEWWAARRIENGIELDLRYDMANHRAARGAQ